MKIEKPCKYLKRKNAENKPLVSKYQTIFNDDFHSFIFFELRPGFGNFTNAWIQIKNFYGNGLIILQKGDNK